MTLLEDVPLQDFNTLAIPAKAAYFADVASAEDLERILANPALASLPRLVLGGGSNIVLRGDFPGVVLHIALQGIAVEESGAERLVKVAAGENWDALVRHCLAQGWYGIENLISIPGSAGAAPIQNIGAYGVELADVLVAVRGWDLNQQQWRRLSCEQCQLGYRSSVFKGELQDRFIITEIELRLSTTASPNTRYAALSDALSGTEVVTPEAVAEAVATMRASRLPDYRQEPNAGSFFKNPIVSAERASVLQQRFPQLVSWPLADGQVKLAAAWLVEQCGWKGRRQGEVGIHPRQAIVLVNYGRTKGETVLALAGAIQSSVADQFGVSLEIEPRLY